MSWRLNWALREVLDASARRAHRSALRQPGRYWLAMLLKLVPGLWKAPIALTLRDGMMFRVHEFMTLYIYREIFVDGCYDVALGTAGTPHVVDVGANTGLFALRMRQLHPNAIVHCYEPMPSNFDQLRWNLEANGLRDCIVHPEGVGGTGRIERLFVHRRNVGGHSIHAAIADGAESIEIRLTGIAEVIGRLGPAGCALLKLDCEGAEREIILAIDAPLAARIERVIFEPTPALYAIDELKTHFDRLGYDVAWKFGTYLATRRDVARRAPVPERVDAA